MRNRWWVLGLAVGLIGCGSPSESSIEEAEDLNPAVAVGRDTLVLAIGQEATVPGTDLKVRVEAVRNDSRCPIDAICVWAGDAEVEITLSRNSASSRHVVHWANGPNRPGSASAHGYRVALVQLDPMPRAATGAPAPSAYRAYLKVERS